MNYWNYEYLVIYFRAFNNASVLELVDKGDSKSPAFGRGGSSPPTGTIFNSWIILTRPRVSLKAYIYKALQSQLVFIHPS